MAQNTESQILEVARRNFVQNGFAGTRMQVIADEAGINKAMLHYYFRSKDKLYQEILTQTLSNFVPKIAGAMEGEGTFDERLEHIVDTYIKTLISEPDIPFFIMSELSQKRERFVEELKKQARFFPAIQRFLQLIMEEMQSGKIRNTNPVQLLLSIISMTVFPFIAKPVFCTIMDIPEDGFNEIMKERKEIILDFIRHSLKPD